MATPVIESAADSASGNGTETSHTVTLPAGIAANDLILLSMSLDAPAGATISWPAGYTEMYDTEDDNGGVSGSTAYRYADGTEGATISVTTSAARKSATRVYRISGAEDPATQAPEYGLVTSGGASTTHTPPSITPTGGSKDYLYFADLHFNTTISVTTYPTGYTDTGLVRSFTSGATTGFAYARKSTTGSSTETPSDYVISAARDCIPVTIAIHPPAGAGGAFTLAADTGAYTVTGTANSLLLDALLGADTGSYSYTGTSADLTSGYGLQADSGSHSYTGTAASLTADLLLAANTGSYAYTGTANALTRDGTLTADTGAYTYTGTEAALTFASAGNFTLTALTGAYSVSGTNADLVRAAILGSDSGAYSYSGTAVDFTTGYGLTVDSGSYSYTGTVVTFSSTIRLNAESGNYVYNGNNATLRASGQVWTVQTDSVTTWTTQTDSNTIWNIED